jgi:hypothetical protein
MRNKLNPCSKCGDRELVGMMGTGIMCLECGFIGPLNDPNGDKWNALYIETLEKIARDHTDATDFLTYTKRLCNFHGDNKLDK